MERDYAVQKATIKIVSFLKGLGHEIRIALKWYGLIGLG
jgi:hypothetical protein